MVQNQQQQAIYNKIRDFLMEQVRNGDKPHEMATFALLVHEWLHNHQDQVVQGLMELMHDETSKASMQQASTIKIKWLMSTIDWTRQANK